MISSIRLLLQEDTPQSVTYAALEARLAIEKVCYDRLRQRHDYISHADLVRWQPGYVINTILAEVDSHMRFDMTLQVAELPQAEDSENEFVSIGTEIGFNPTRISKMWNALAKLALHVRMPEHREDEISEYGDKESIRTKVNEVIEELEGISKGNMTFSGVGMQVWFLCECGQKNIRRAALLKIDQVVSCFNPDCMRSFRVEKDDKGSFAFVLDFF